MRFWKQHAGSPKGFGKKQKDKGKGKKGLSIQQTNQPNVHNAEGYIQQGSIVTNDTDVLPGDAHIGTTGSAPGVPEPGRKTWSQY